MMTSSPEELARMQAVHAFRILDTPPEAVFNQLVQFAAHICRTPIAIITIIDERRQWFKAAVGLDLHQTDRAISFCTHTIQQKTPLIVSDTHAHPLFNQNPFVVDEPHLRFYAGVPLIATGGAAIGSLAVMDIQPRMLDEAQLATLSMLAEQVILHMELRRQRQQLEAVAAERRRMNQALQRQALHLQEAQRIAQVGSWELDLQTDRVLLSEQASRIFGIAHQDHPQDRAALLRRVHAEVRPDIERIMADAVKFGHALDLEYRLVSSDSTIRHIRSRVHVSGQNHGLHAILGTVQDVTQQHQAQERLHLLDASISRLNEIVMITEAEPHDEPGPRIVFVNHAFERITGYAPADVIGHSPRLLQGPNTQRTALDRIRTAIEQRQPVLVELINYTRTGQEFWLESHITPVAQDHGQVSHFVAIQRDITQRKLAEAHIERLAFYDSLTQLPNRRLLLDRLHQACAIIRRGRHMGALFFIDLDNFKSLNDTLGHDKGDLLLQQIASRLAVCVRSTNTVARLGGDEFVVMLEDLSEMPLEAATQAKLVGEKILGTFAPPFELDSHAYHCTASVGVTLFDSQLQHVDELFQRADLAMYQAKASGRNALRFFDPEMQAVVTTRVELERQMRHGLQAQEFVLHYQPQTNAAGAVIGFEALVRWRHPAQGLMLPGVFIALAEDTGLILPLGSWVLTCACRQIAAWSNRPGQPQLSVAVNISARQFRHQDFVDQVLAALHNSGANPRNLKLELTESILVEDIEGTISKMQSLQDTGVGFSLDDFGTGYSSLSYLKRLPLNQLKIDQSFIRDVLTDPNDAAIAHTIVALGQTLGLEVIAEGVETQGQYDFLAQLGCHAYQGYFVGYPQPAEQF